MFEEKLEQELNAFDNANKDLITNCVNSVFEIIKSRDVSVSLGINFQELSSISKLSLKESSTKENTTKLDTKPDDKKKENTTKLDTKPDGEKKENTTKLDSKPDDEKQ